MRRASIFMVLGGFIAFVASRPQESVKREFKGVATFNNYAVQPNTVCGPHTANVTGYFGAAAGDISHDISGGLCEGSIDMNLCTGGRPTNPNYTGPACPKTNCGVCYKVTNIGNYGTINPADNPSAGSVFIPPGARSVTVQIIDSCPASNAWNFCKHQIDISLDQRCGDSHTNSLDIDLGAYVELTGQQWTNGPSPNLIIAIEPVTC